MTTKYGTLGTDARWRSLLGMSVVIGSCLMLPVVGHADDRDQERALKALRAGEVRQPMCFPH